MGDSSEKLGNLKHTATGWRVSLPGALAGLNCFQGAQLVLETSSQLGFSEGLSLALLCSSERDSTGKFLKQEGKQLKKDTEIL